MKTDTNIKRDVEAEIQWDPDIESPDIGVTAKDGVVTLTGFVPACLQKFEAENDAKRVAGVVGVANDIEVRPAAHDQRADPEIARDAVDAIKRELPISYQNLKVVVRDAWVTIEGDVEWNYQRERAESAVHRVRSVRGVINSIQVKPKATPTEIKRQIEEALMRSAELDAHSIAVEARDGEVVLKGTVHSWFEREQAERAAWRAPGVRKVEDRIVIRP